MTHQLLIPQAQAHTHTHVRARGAVLVCSSYELIAEYATTGMARQRGRETPTFILKLLFSKYFCRPGAHQLPYVNITTIELTMQQLKRQVEKK